MSNLSGDSPTRYYLCENWESQQGGECVEVSEPEVNRLFGMEMVRRYAELEGEGEEVYVPVWLCTLHDCLVALDSLRA